MGYDIIGIGSPLIDALAKVDDKVLSGLKLQKGNMHLLEQKDVQKIFSSIKIEKIVPGDSTANTIVAASDLGMNAAYIGKVGNDEYGKFFTSNLNGIHSKIVVSKSMTGSVIALITPDMERTMIVFLGAAKELHRTDINPEDIIQSKILHLTGYQLEEKNLKEASLYAMEIAKKNNVKISLDLADGALVKRNHKFIKEIVKNYADILFSNEKEAMAFTNKQPKEALDEIGKMCEIAIVKIGSEGSLVKRGNEFHKIPIFKVNAIDTTGAGDMYAAGFLYGLSQGFDLDKCGKIGSYASSKIVEQIGARLEYSLKEKIKGL